MADISKIKLADGTVVTLKDAAQRADFSTLLGENTLAALKTAAWKDAQTTWSSETGHTDELPTVAAVKSYVDAQIEAIPTFECVVCPADAAQIPAGAIYRDGTTEITGTMAASESTYKKIYLVKDSKAGAGAYNEYLTIRSGAKGSYTYAWEAIGSTVIDLSGYVQKTTQIAGVSISTGIAKADLQAALDLDALAYKASASGSTTLSTVDGITMKEVTVSGNAAVTTSSAAATLTKADYTPAGTISGKTTAAGSIAVTLKDANAEASITYGSYTPAGTIAATEGGDFSALKTAVFGEVSESATGAIQIEGENSKPDITITASTENVIKSVKDAAVAPTFSEGAFTAATWTGSSYTAPSWTGSSYTAPTLSDATKAAFANEGIVATVNTSASEGAADYELLVFTSASTASAVTAQGAFDAGSVAFGTFGAGSVAFGTFDGGSKAADTFSAGAAATFNTADVLKEGTSAALDAAPAFTGKYYNVATTADTALKTVAFAGTSADIKATKVEYNKQEVSSATFTGAEADITATFSGSVAASILTTGVAYEKANGSAAFSVNVTPEVSAIASSAKEINITVS